MTGSMQFFYLGGLVQSVDAKCKQLPQPGFKLHCGRALGVMSAIAHI